MFKVCSTVGLLVFALSTGAHAQPAVPPVYEMSVVPDMYSFLNQQGVLAVSENGWVAGWSEVDNLNNYVTLWRISPQGAREGIVTVPTGYYSHQNDERFSLAINNSGRIAYVAGGRIGTCNPGENAAMVPFGYTNFHLGGINDDGSIYLIATNGDTDVYSGLPSALIARPSCSPGVGSVLFASNTYGTSAGHGNPSTGQDFGFRCNGSSLERLPRTSTHTSGIPAAISSTGWIAGIAHPNNSREELPFLPEHLMVWSPTNAATVYAQPNAPFGERYETLGEVHISDINDAGTVVGTMKAFRRSAFTPGEFEVDSFETSRAFITLNGQLHDLNQLVRNRQSGWNITHATAINNSGTIVGMLTHDGNTMKPVILRPVATSGSGGLPPTKPAPIDLAARSDTGTSDNDNVTNAKSLAFTGTSAAAGRVTLYVDGVATRATATVNRAGAYSLTLPNAPVGRRNYTVVVTDTRTRLASSQSDPLIVDVQRTPPAAAAQVSLFDLDAVAAPPRTREPATASRVPNLTGTAPLNATVQLLLNGKVVGVTMTLPNGEFYVQPAQPVRKGVQNFSIRIMDRAGNFSRPVSLKVRVL